MISINKNCTEMRMLFNSGPAIYRDDIATRDVNKLKKVSHTISINIYVHISLQSIGTLGHLFFTRTHTTRLIRPFTHVPNLIHLRWLMTDSQFYQCQ